MGGSFKSEVAGFLKYLSPWSSSHTIQKPFALGCVLLDIICVVRNKQSAPSLCHRRGGENGEGKLDEGERALKRLIELRLNEAVTNISNGASSWPCIQLTCLVTFTSRREFCV